MSDLNTGDSPEMQMLKKIDAGIDELKEQVANVEKRAIRYGAAAGAGAGAMAGGIVAMGISFARAKLGL
ncbi:TPA: hypothetical protein QDB40_004636 [Burkholderia vietnamiensis]|uniref:Uncharacterized protein n=1 Tax=Burkholderia vietnamiensis (strain G4 / LMG 22486) TaxID=269482 RepID=A4JDG7_BURVG|nr:MULTISPECIES: hypothetical protein [Burkholderia cepacia complex]ABO54320.1 conserved hypothetical protein [Burkholderia vietnamiensis G4]KVE13207.1 hypothetical protein WI92_14755 [Burkholderia vietnamiensis]KVF35389.1 hypothetical protein WJ09_10450 [Burkholderia vietnamiensis]KVS12917.1 hypothetical protein WK32_32370 [Burkholderia vietnamiensis]KVS43807.1 hypothetical protein WK35_23625 [Burkholderia vietnamiensis]